MGGFYRRCGAANLVVLYQGGAGPVTSAGCPSVADDGPLTVIARDNVDLNKVIRMGPGCFALSGSLLTPRSAPTTLLGRNGYLTPLGQGCVETGGSANAAPVGRWSTRSPPARCPSGFGSAASGGPRAADDRVYRRLIELLP